MSFLKAIDHLVLAGPDLEQLEQWWRDVSGVPAQSGGSHQGRGTKNALVGLDSSTYLELIGPDPDQHEHTGSMPFGIDSMVSTRLVTFAMAVKDLDSAAAVYSRNGIELSPVEGMSRMRPDETLLEWRLAFPSASVHEGVVPFLIEWADDLRHPSQSLDNRVDLVSLDLTHPEPEPIQAALSEVSGTVAKISSGKASLAAVFGTLRGPVVVSSSDSN